MHVSVADSVIAAKGKAAIDDIHILQHKMVLLFLYLIFLLFYVLHVLY